MSASINIVILAAGASTRMGRIKQLLPWKGGTLLSQAITTAVTTGLGPVTVVLGANALEVEQQIVNEQAIAIKNSKWKEGMGSSIVCGLEYARTNFPECTAILFMLADQPLIDVSFLKQLIAEYEAGRTSIVATAYGKAAGVPALFDQRHFDTLMTLSKAYGARDIIAENADSVIALDPKGKQQDIDTKEDYGHLLSRSSQ